MNQFVETLLTIFTVIIILFVVFGSLFGAIAYLSIQDEKAHDMACKEIGLKSWERNMGQEYCEDEDYNLHYVKMINKGGFFHWEYKAIKISIGDVTTKQDALTRKHDG